MNRRNFLKSMAVAGATALAPKKLEALPTQTDVDLIDYGEYGVQFIHVDGNAEFKVVVHDKIRVVDDTGSYYENKKYIHNWNKVPEIGVTPNPGMVVLVNELSKVVVQIRNGRKFSFSPVFEEVITKYGGKERIPKRIYFTKNLRVRNV